MKYCTITETRLDSINKNLVDNMKVVDTLIGKSIRKNMEKTTTKLNVSLQFLYSSDLDGWYDEKNRTIYLSLDHAIKSPIQVCFDREISKCRDTSENLQSKGSNSSNEKHTCAPTLMIIVALLISAIAGLSFVPEEYDSYVIPIVIGIAFVYLFIKELKYSPNDGLFGNQLKIRDKRNMVSPILGTMNNIGGVLEFIRLDMATGKKIYYNYFQFWGVPLFFLGSYIAEEIETNTGRRKSYKVFAQIETSWREIYHFYIIRYGILIIIGVIVYIIFLLGRLFGWWN